MIKIFGILSIITGIELLIGIFLYVVNSIHKMLFYKRFDKAINYLVKSALKDDKKGCIKYETIK